nr:hypothetical protein [Janthinobacterium sp. 1_2014MBL_MicDiv]
MRFSSAGGGGDLLRLRGTATGASTSATVSGTVSGAVSGAVSATGSITGPIAGSEAGVKTGSGSGGGTDAAAGGAATAGAATPKLNAHLGQNLASGLQSWPHWPQDLPCTGTAAANVVPQEEQNLAPGLFSAWQERHFNWHLFSYKRWSRLHSAIARITALLPYG